MTVKKSLKYILLSVLSALIINSNCWADSVAVLDMAEDIGIEDSGGYYTSDEVEGALQEVGSLVPAGGAVGGSGTTDYIPKWTDSDTLTDSIIYDDGKVGIGTTTPSETLDVVGTVQISNPSGQVGYIQNDANGVLATGQKVSGQFMEGFSEKQIAWGSTDYPGGLATDNEGELMWDTDTKRMGIGTTAPATKLEVNGDITVGEDDWIGIGSGSERIVFNGSADDIRFDNTDVMIGGTLANTKLYILKSTRGTVTGNQYGIFNQHNYSASGGVPYSLFNRFTLKDGAKPQGTFSLRMETDVANGATVDFGNNRIPVNFQNIDRIGSTVTGDNEGLFEASLTYNGNTDIDGTFNMFDFELAGSGTLTTASYFRLINYSDSFSGTHTGSSYGVGIDIDMTQSHWVYSTGAVLKGKTYGLHVEDGSGVRDIYNEGETYLEKDLTVDTNTLVVKSDTDKVGIGTTAPNTLLNVYNGDIEIDAISNDGEAEALYFRKSRAGSIVQAGDILGFLNWASYDGDSYETSAEIVAFVDGTPGDSDTPGMIYFRTTPDGARKPSTRMVIKEDGDIGIGTETPSYDLEIYSESSQDQFAITGTNHCQVEIDSASGKEKMIDLQTANSTKWKIGIDDLGVGAVDDFKIESVNNSTAPEIYIRRSDGYIGIGTTAPAYSVSQVQDGYAYYGTVTNNPSLEAGYYLKCDSFQEWYVYTDSGGGLNFYDDDVNMTIASDGGIHIPNMKTGTTQAAAGAAAGELWADSDDGYTVKLGQ